MLYQIREDVHQKEVHDILVEMEKLTQEILDLITQYRLLVEKSMSQMNYLTPHQEIYPKQDLESLNRANGITNLQNQIEYKQQQLKINVSRLYMYLGIEK